MQNYLKQIDLNQLSPELLTMNGLIQMLNEQYIELQKTKAENEQLTKQLDILSAKMNSIKKLL